MRNCRKRILQKKRTPFYKNEKISEEYYHLDRRVVWILNLNIEKVRERQIGSF